MRTLSKLLAIPAAAGFLFAAGCSSSPCAKAVDNMISFTKKDGSAEDKKMLDMLEAGKDAFVKMCEEQVKKDPKQKTIIECQAGASDLKALQACESAAHAKKDAPKKDAPKKDEHK